MYCTMKWESSFYRAVLLSEQTALEVSPLATGRYSLVLSNSKENLKTFNIIKTR